LLPIAGNTSSQAAERRVTSFGRLTMSPAWTPDGRNVFFLSADFKSNETEL
jgi:Tol biopolymer transport system component